MPSTLVVLEDRSDEQGRILARTRVGSTYPDEYRIRGPHQAALEGIRQASGGRLEDGYYHVPVRFFGSKDSTLNIVDLDFVTQALFYIGLHAPDSNKTYHLTNPQPVKNLRLLEIIMELYKTQWVHWCRKPGRFYRAERL